MQEEKPQTLEGSGKQWPTAPCEEISSLQTRPDQQGRAPGGCGHSLGTQPQRRGSALQGCADFLHHFVKQGTPERPSSYPFSSQGQRKL